MAMGARAQREAENAIACMRPFKNSTGSFYGTRGSARHLGWADSSLRGEDLSRARELIRRATYIVWSYNTPLGFVAEDENGEVQKFYLDVHHSATTSHHQTILRVAWGDFETIGSGPATAAEARSSRAPLETRPVSLQAAFNNTRSSVSFRDQDDLMDEVRGYVHPAHP